MAKAKTRAKKGSFFSPLVIFILYILLSGLAIMGFRFFVPAVPVPLAHFSVQWRLIQGFLEYIALFPALVLTAIVIPFGFKIFPIEEDKRPHNPLESLSMSITTAITASVVYGLLFSIALPIARNYEANLLFQSQLYNLARARAEELSREERWAETAQLIAICESIWPEGPEHARLRIEAEIEVEEERLIPVQRPDFLAEQASASMGTAEPVNATEALAMAETAFAEKRYFDAHWLATLSGRLAGPGTLEEIRSTRLAGMAWTEVTSLEPSAFETTAYNNYRLKNEGYEALVGGEWIRAYYIFLSLMELTPNDPDVARYLALSENGIRQVAFFTDEIALTLERTFRGAVEVVFSFPMNYGRVVMKVFSLSVFADYAYGIEAEIMAFDRNGQPIWDMEIPYIKLLPLSLDSGRSLSILLRALDRAGKAEPYEPAITVFGQNTPDNSEIVLPVSWETFLLLSNLNRGLSALSPLDLRAAADSLANSGYLPEVFESELLQRFVKPLFLLPMGIFAIALGWRYRTLKRAWAMAFSMLVILPVVFNGTMSFAKSWLNELGILAVVSLGFTATAIFYGVGVVILFILSLLILAFAHR